MKNYLLSAICIILNLSTTLGQANSNCTPSMLFLQEYQQDIYNLSLTRIFEVNSADTALIEIPELWKDTIEQGLAAIFNATSLPERDTIFNLYCVHDRNSTIQSHAAFIIKLDSNYAWTQAWMNLNALTGDAYIDDLVQRYGLTVQQFYNWSNGPHVVVNSQAYLNSYALIDSLEISGGIVFAEANSIIGAACNMDYFKVGTDRYFDFYFEFNDCFDGCDNFRKWRFKVDTACQVSFLGAVDWGFFGVTPLPSPINCNVFNNIPKKPTVSNSIHIFPNPVDEILFIEQSALNDADYFKLYDNKGTLVLSGTLQATMRQQIELQQLSAGTYFLQITGRTNSNHIIIKSAQ